MKTSLNGNEVSQPQGINEITQEITYYDEYRGLFTFLSGDLQFTGDGYDFIESEVFDNPCSLIDFLLYIDNKETFKGTIDVSDITEMNVTSEYVKTPVQDNNLSAYITKNSKIKTFLNLETSKNGETITPATHYDNVKFFNPYTCSNDFDISNVYPVGDTFRYLIDFMSDNTLSYQSPLFDSGGELEGVCIISGKDMCKIEDSAPQINFYDLFSEMNKIFNLAIYVDFSGVNPKIIIDKYDNIFTEDDLLVLDNIKDVTIKFSKENFYSKVKLGSSKTQESGGNFTFPDISFLGFREEEYFIGGQCNIDNELNLVNEWIIDNNIIEDVLVNGNDTYEKDIFIVETEYDNLLSSHVAYKYTDVITGICIYNIGLSNSSKANNWSNSLTNDLLSYLSLFANGFKAERNNNYSIPTGALIFNTEIIDYGSNYDNATGKYTCPLDGTYTFSIHWDDCIIYPPIGANDTIYLTHKDSFGATINTYLIYEFEFTADPYYTDSLTGISFSASKTFYLNSGDYVIVEGFAPSGHATIIDSFFSGTPNDEGGVFQSSNSYINKVYEINFKCPITHYQYDNIRNNITKRIIIKTGKKTFIGWVKNLKRNILTGMCEFTLRTSGNILKVRNINR